MNRPGPAIPRNEVLLRFTDRLRNGWVISGTSVIMLERALADAVVKALTEATRIEPTEEQHGRLLGDMMTDHVRFKDAPEQPDWGAIADAVQHLNTGIANCGETATRQIVLLEMADARVIRDAVELLQKLGVPPRMSLKDATPEQLEALRKALALDRSSVIVAVDEGPTALDVIEWLEEQDWDSVSASFMADCARERFELPEPVDPSIASLEHWQAQGFTPGDVVDKRGSVLDSDGNVRSYGALRVTGLQAVRAEWFGWERVTGINPTPSDLVQIERRP